MPRCASSAVLGATPGNAETVQVGFGFTFPIIRTNQASRSPSRRKLTNRLLAEIAKFLALLAKRPAQAANRRITLEKGLMVCKLLIFRGR